MKRKWFWIALLLVVALGFYLKKKLSIYREKLGEVTFYKDQSLEIKLVRVFENLPLHFVGTVHKVACKSPRTLGFPEWKHDLIEAGWKMIPTSTFLFDQMNGGASLEELADRAKKVYYVQDKTLIVLSATSVSFSLDDCYSIVTWDVVRDLPKEFPVQSTPESEKCEKQHKDNTSKGLANYGDCRYFSFKGDGRPIFEEIKIESGKIAFQMRSNSIKSALSIESNDSGRTWTVK